jgi:hypothetical protein
MGNKKGENYKGVIPTLKQRKIASLMMEGKTGAEIAVAVGQESRFPRQSGAKLIKQKGVKVALASATSSYSPESLRAKLQEIIESPDSQAIAVRAIELAMREKAMLTERTITETSISAEELSRRASEALQGLLNVTGARIAQSAEPESAVSSGN